MLDPIAITADLATAALPRTVRSYDQVASTQDLARQLLHELDEHQLPVLVLADEQTAGRGRMGRLWVAPAGSALLFSLALRPTWLPPDQGVALVWLIAVALCEAVEDVTPLRPGLKWPNDLLVRAVGSHTNDPVAGSTSPLPDDPTPPAAPALGTQSPPPTGSWAKTAGILLEIGLGSAQVDWAIIGCGINLSAAPPAELTRYPATCLDAAAGQTVDRLTLLRALLRRVDAWHERLRHGEGETLFAAWQARLITLGQAVHITAPEGTITGIAEAVNRAGALLVRDQAGILHTITAGDVGLI
ncbi:MAG: biotin--[acetyl-CoA-carboxylase] ligase [Oscillochloridaceae bacterium umkhey_bin13]